MLFRRKTLDGGGQNCASPSPLAFGIRSGYALQRAFTHFDLNVDVRAAVIRVAA